MSVDIASASHPSGPTTQIHLDRNGDIDISESGDTDTDRLKQCAMDTAKP